MAKKKIHLAGKPYENGSLTWFPSLCGMTTSDLPHATDPFKIDCKRCLKSRKTHAKKKL